MKVSSMDHLLEGMSDQRLAEIWCELNRWGWPKDLPNPEQRQPPGTPCNRTEIMNEIHTRIGFKACLREWNREMMTDSEFDLWWRTRGRGRAGFQTVQ